MAEVAKEYHDNLQSLDIDPEESPESRTNNIREITHLNIPRLPNSQKADLAKKNNNERS